MTARYHNMIEPEYVYRFIKAGLSIISLMFVYTHLIGGCQVFVFCWNLYMLMKHVFWFILTTNRYPFDIDSTIPFLGVENVITLASFMCIAGNTEDGMGMSSYEIVAVASGVLWGVHTSYMTYIITKEQTSEPYHYSDIEENFEI